MSLSLTEKDALFLRECYEAIAFSIEFAGVLTDSLSVVLAGDALPEEFFSNEIGVCSSETIVDLYSRGATLRLFAADRYHFKIREVVAFLEKDLSHCVHANAYLTPAECKGVGKHHDEHDVVIVQLNGCKIWNVCDPYSGVEKKYSLTVGDILYVPKGWAHSTHTNGVSSCHVTFGLNAEKKIMLRGNCAKVPKTSNVSLIVLLDNYAEHKNLKLVDSSQEFCQLVQRYLCKKGLASQRQIELYSDRANFQKMMIESSPNARKMLAHIAIKSRAVVN